MSVPPLRSGFVARPRLIEALNRQISGQLLLISAPADFGKTSLLSQWSAQSRARVAWVSLEASENDPIRFWRYLLTALEAAFPGTGHETLELLQGPQAPPLEAVLIALLNRLAFLTDDLALILDDYHLMTTQRIHDTLAFFLEHLPARLHLVIANGGCC